MQQLSLLAPQSSRPGPLRPSQLVPLVVDPVQAPPLHVPLAHGQGVPHSAVTPQVCTAEFPAITPQMGADEIPEQVVLPGTHWPMG